MVLKKPSEQSDIGEPMNNQDDIQILIIDDNELYCKMLVKLIEKMGMTSRYETTLKMGIETAASEAFDVVFLDVNLPDGSGLDGIPLLREGVSPPEIIIITGVGDADGAEIAIQNHAWDYITKDVSLQSMKLSLDRAIEYRRQKKAATSNIVLKQDGIIGKGPLISNCLEQAGKAAITDSPVLILGETGTGKEVFAQAIHDNSPRTKGDFVVVDCSALPDHLVESTLFGHKKGAFTSADSDRIGLVEQAHDGTLFLDEIGELAVHYVNHHPCFADRGPYIFSQDILEALQAYSWPGNVRELFNTIDYICSENPLESEIFTMHLPTHIRAEITKNRIKASGDTALAKQAPCGDNGDRKLIPLKKLLEQTRFDYIKKLISVTGGDIAEACRVSELSRGHLYDLLKKYQLRS